jgi:hypothetical protein
MIQIRVPDPGWKTQIIFLRAEKPIFLVTILKFFDADPGSMIQDGKNSDPGSGIQDGKNLDPGSGIRDGRSVPALVAQCAGTGGAVCKGATPLVEQ